MVMTNLKFKNFYSQFKRHTAFYKERELIGFGYHVYLAHFVGFLMTFLCHNKSETLHEWSTPNRDSNPGPLQPGTQGSGVTPRHQISLTFFISYYSLDTLCRGKPCLFICHPTFLPSFIQLNVNNS